MDRGVPISSETTPYHLLIDHPGESLPQASARQPVSARQQSSAGRQDRLDGRDEVDQARSLLGLLAHVVLLAISGATYQAIASERDQRRYAEIDQVRNTEDIGNKPLAVVSASDHRVDTMADTEAEARRTEQAAQDLQRELTGLSSDSAFCAVAGSDHASVVLNRDQARQTSEEILNVVKAVRTGQPLAQ